ncbi:MAG: protease inhibitor I9 family protein, partial [Rhizobiales bacterium]|nr:protease inhibitor I9 family protein [Hyphomicrobiales bacterium]
MVALYTGLKMARPIASKIASGRIKSTGSKGFWSMRLSPLLARAALVVAVLVASVAALAAPGTEAQRGREPGQTGRPIEDRYIVVLRDGVGEPRNAANELARAHRLSVSDVYDTVLNGFAARVPAQALDGLRRNPRVAFVDQDVTIAAAA